MFQKEDTGSTFRCVLIIFKFNLFRTSDMASDALELVDSLNWTNFHIVGVSMGVYKLDFWDIWINFCSKGGMISQELALLVPDRIQSLSLAVTHSGGITAIAPVCTILNFSFAWNSELNYLVRRNTKYCKHSSIMWLFFFDYHYSS